MKLTTAYRHWHGECAYCGVQVELPAPKEMGVEANDQTATRDHFIPRSAGGKSIAANLVLACNACNGKKANLDPRSVVRVWARIDPVSLAEVIRGELGGSPDSAILLSAVALLDRADGETA